MNTILWPPKYTVKKHSSARHIKLKTSIQRGLELIVPSRFNLKNIPSILENNKQWIEKQLHQLQLRLQLTHTEVLPDKIEFHAINQLWNIQYVASNVKLQIIKRPHQELVLLGNIENESVCKEMLIDWIKEQAKIYLFLQLKTLSEQVGLPYSKATIRDQQTRWGSCSRRKSINLNYKLLFFPAHLLAHIIIHELCHTIHLNHSSQFWQLVSQYDPHWEQHRSEIRQARKFIPTWIG